MEAANTHQTVCGPAKVEDSSPGKFRVDNFEGEETFGILQFLDRLEEVTDTYLKR